jgi:hypothetical protein
MKQRKEKLATLVLICVLAHASYAAGADGTKTSGVDSIENVLHRLQVAIEANRLESTKALNHKQGVLFAEAEKAWEEDRDKATEFATMLYGKEFARVESANMAIEKLIWFRRLNLLKHAYKKPEEGAFEGEFETSDLNPERELLTGEREIDLQISFNKDSYKFAVTGSTRTLRGGSWQEISEQGTERYDTLTFGENRLIRVGNDYILQYGGEFHLLVRTKGKQAGGESN